MTFSKSSTSVNRAAGGTRKGRVVFFLPAVFCLLLNLASPAGAADLINENFNSTFPAGWLTNSLVYSAAGGYGGSACWYINANADYMVTPLLVHPMVLTFQYRGTSGSNLVWINTNQDPADPGWRAIATNAGTGAFIPVTIGLSNAGDIYLKFTRRSSLGNHYIDNMVVTGFVPPDTNAPAFDPSSLTATVNNKVAWLSWSRAVDAENSGPVWYFVYASTNTNRNLTDPMVTEATTNTNATLSLVSGVWYLDVRAADSSSNVTPFPAAELRIRVFAGTAGLDGVYFYPNPVRQGETVHFNNFTDAALIRIYNVRGDLILETPEKNVVLPDGLAAGIYYVAVRDGAAKKIKKLIYLR